MARFVRPAAWLRQLFTQSQTQPVNPAQVTDDVSLTHPYDGGGWPLFDPGQWSVVAASAAAIAGTTTLLTVGPLEIVRVLAVQASLTAGVAPSCKVQAGGPAISSVVLSAPVLATAEGFAIPFRCPVIGPGHVLQGRHFGGSAATVITWTIYHVRAPISTVFYL